MQRYPPVLITALREPTKIVWVFVGKATYLPHLLTGAIHTDRPFFVICRYTLGSLPFILDETGEERFRLNWRRVRRSR